MKKTKVVTKLIAIILSILVVVQVAPMSTFAELVGGKSHIQKGIERVAGLKNIIKKGGLSSSELALAKRLLEDLEKALRGK